uniref:Uncharacterized protein n=1 Tax=Oryza brachyantha TaxID=4533 RepID=J3N8K0_ORYBR
MELPEQQPDDAGFSRRWADLEARRRQIRALRRRLEYGPGGRRIGRIRARQRGAVALGGSGPGGRVAPPSPAAPPVRVVRGAAKPCD